MTNLKKILRVYADTSVIGGCYDPEFEIESNLFIEMVRRKKIQLIISDVVITELEKAPPKVRAIIDSLSKDHIEHVPVTDQALILRDAYLAAKVVNMDSMDDAAHVALATVSRADAIVSWNFKHIVRLDRIKGFNQVNYANGYGNIVILSPKEVCTNEPR